MFIVYYQYLEKGTIWRNGRTVSSQFSMALDELNKFNILAERRPDLYRNVTCDFEDILES